MAVFDRAFRSAGATWIARFLGGPDNASGPAVPMQAIALNPDTPVSADNPFPTTDADVLAAVQAVTAKLLAAPATEDKQDAANLALAGIYAAFAPLMTEAKGEAIRLLLAGSLKAIAPPPTSSTVAIATGQSVSAAAQIDGKLAGIILPTGWTTAAVTFLGSADGGTFFPIYDAGVERAIASADAVAGRLIALNLSDWLGVKFVQIRSGTAAAAVNQTSARTIALLEVA